MIDAVTKLVVTSLEMFLDKYVCHENVWLEHSDWDDPDHEYDEECSALFSVTL